MDVKHTPGPWRYDGGEIIGNSRIVATMCWCSGMGAEDEANNRLVAAAPDLLRELKNCVWLLDDLQPKPGLVQQQARAAIAKATGKTLTPKQRDGEVVNK